MEKKSKELENLIKQYAKPIEEEEKVDVQPHVKEKKFDFKREDIRKGIILSEILGPPKGRIK